MHTILTPRIPVMNMVQRSVPCLLAFALSCSSDGKPNDPLPQTSAPTECAAGYKMCDGACVSRDNPDFGCGDGCTPCATGPMAYVNCEGGACTMSCQHEFGDCNGVPEDGCETALRDNPEHCGSCDNVCPQINGASQCEIFQCSPIVCSPGYFNADQDESTGCETDDLCSSVEPSEATLEQGSCPVDLANEGTCLVDGVCYGCSPITTFSGSETTVEWRATELKFCYTSSCEDVPWVRLENPCNQDGRTCLFSYEGELQYRAVCDGTSWTAWRCPQYCQ